MKTYQDIINERKINYLIHFTKSSNLPFILGDEQLQSTPNGIVSDDLLPKEIERNDKKRNDQHTNYICCSVQFPNLKYQYRQKKTQEDNLFNEWAFIYIDPTIIDNSTLFSPVNAASGNGINLDCGIDAFEKIFEDKFDFWKCSKTRGMQPYTSYRPKNLPNCYASNMQAEILIKERIPIESIKEIRFPASTFDYEKSRLNLCHVDLTHIKLSKFNENQIWDKEKELWPED